jgi:hypothetical protein
VLMRMHLRRSHRQQSSEAAAVAEAGSEESSDVLTVEVWPQLRRAAGTGPNAAAAAATGADAAAASAASGSSQVKPVRLAERYRWVCIDTYGCGSWIYCNGCAESASVKLGAQHVSFLVQQPCQKALVGGVLVMLALPLA